MYKKVEVALLSCLIIIQAHAQEKPANTAPATATAFPMAPAELPGKGLVQHDFFYAGEGNKVISIVKNGALVWNYTDTARGEISDAALMANGNTLITSNKNFVREVNPKGETMWEFTPADLPGIRFSGLQKSIRLANGNTLIGNWARKGDSTAVQAVEVSPDKKLVWALRSWNDPDLGRSTTIQVLDTPAVYPEKAHFGKFK